jgi:hypothetical protein
MARRSTAKATPPAENLSEVVAEPYTEDDNWDGEVEVSETENTEVAETEEAPAKKSRPGSPLLQATRDYEREHKRAEKARKAYEKYAPLIADKDDAEAAEAEALARLTTLLNRTNDTEGDGADS